MKEHYARNYYADSSELSTMSRTLKFFSKLTGFI